MQIDAAKRLDIAVVLLKPLSLDRPTVVQDFLPSQRRRSRALTVRPARTIND